MLRTQIGETRGKNLGHTVGEKMVIGDPRILFHEIEALCTHAPSSALHYVIALNKPVDPKELSFSRDESRAYAQYVDSEEPYTDCCTVIAKCSQIEE